MNILSILNVGGLAPAQCRERSHRKSRRRTHRIGPRVQASSTSLAIDTETIDEYNKSMRERMGWDTCDVSPFEYHPERGLYFHLVWSLKSQLICGSQPQTVEDIVALYNQGVTGILSLQQPKDLEYWGVDGDALFAKAAELGIEYVRVGAADFDPDSLRSILPSAVRELERLRQAADESGKVYVHCTAGLGRAPAVIIAWIYWFTSMDLDDAYTYLTSIRPCGPKKESIRGATFDILDQRHRDEFPGLPEEAWRYLSASDRALIAQRLFDFADNN